MTRQTQKALLHSPQVQVCPRLGVSGKLSDVAVGQ